MPAGYSGRPLAQRLGLKEGLKIAILNPPQGYSRTLGNLRKHVLSREQSEGPLDFLQFFTKQRAELDSSFPVLKQKLSPTGALWISWPKGTSKVSTNLNENIVREIGLKNGMVDVKVCAVDETWSGLKFVYRVNDRK